jgi:hypothetical protein
MTMRRVLVRVLAPALVGAGLVLGSGVPAHACSCIMPSVRASALGADAVFVGRVGPAVGSFTNLVEVSRVYQGSVPTEVTVNTGMEGPGVSTSCDYELPLGKELLFFADGSGDAYSAGPCAVPSSPTDPVVERLEAITGGPSEAPEPASPAATPGDEGSSRESADVASGVAGTAGTATLGIGVLLGLGLMAAGVVAVMASRRRQ